MTRVSGLIYGVLLRGDWPRSFAPYLSPLQAGAPPSGLELEVRYRRWAALPKLEEIWAVEPQPPFTRDRLALSRQAQGCALTVEGDNRGRLAMTLETITVDWVAGGAAPHFLFTYALPLWLELQGLPVLHASAVSLGGHAVAFVGPSGVGKSTLCAGLARSGCGFVADDGLPLFEGEGGGWHCFPGPPWLRLWPSALERALGTAAEGLPRVREGVDKRRLEVTQAGSAETAAGLPLAAIYVLERRTAATGAVAARPYSPREAVVRLVEHSIASAPAAALGLSAARLERLARVAQRVPVRKLTFPSGEPAWQAVREALAADGL